MEDIKEKTLCEIQIEEVRKAFEILHEELDNKESSMIAKIVIQHKTAGLPLFSGDK